VVMFVILIVTSFVYIFLYHRAQRQLGD